MRSALIAIALLLLCGCQPLVRQINPGAELPIYVASPDRLRAELAARGDAPGPARQVRGFYDRQAREIWIDGTLPRDQFAATMVHEFAHVLEDAAHWRVVYAARGYHGTFDTFSRDHDPDADMTDRPPVIIEVKP